MPSWKKVITSGSDAALNHITSSGNISGSSTSTGSFGLAQSEFVKHRVLKGWYNDNTIYDLPSGGSAGIRIAPPTPASGNSSLPIQFTNNAVQIQRSHNTLRLEAFQGSVAIYDTLNTETIATFGRSGLTFSLGSISGITHVSASGNISGSSTSTGSFGSVIVDNNLNIGTQIEGLGGHLTFKTSELTFTGNGGQVQFGNSNSSFNHSSGKVFTRKDTGYGDFGDEAFLATDHPVAAGFWVDSAGNMQFGHDNGAGVRTTVQMMTLGPQAGHASGSLLVSGSIIAKEGNISGSATSTGSFGVLELSSTDGMAKFDFTKGTNNFSIGYGGTGQNLTTGAVGNVFVGYGVGSQVTTGDQNVGLGYQAITGGNATGNTAVGYRALKAINSGIGNVAIGRTAGDAVQTGNYNIAIGQGAGFTGTGATNQIGIGYDVTVPGDNQTVIGASPQTHVIFGGSNTLISGSAGSTGSFGRVVAGDSFLGGKFEKLRLTDSGQGNYINFKDSTDRAHLGFSGGSDNNFNIWNIENGSQQFATNNTLRMTIAAAGDVTIANGLITTGNITANGNIVGDGSTTISGIDTITSTNYGGNISGSSTSTGSFGKLSVGGGNITTSGNMILDADGAQIRLQDGGTEFGRISRVSSDLVIKSISNNNDILFKGVDGGGTITALQLDMSEGGNAIFNGNVQVASGGFVFSAGALTLQSGAGTNLVLDAGAGADEITLSTSAFTTTVPIIATGDLDLYAGGGTKVVGLTTSAISLLKNTSISGNLAVDTNVLYVDSSADKVGINRIDPQFDLDVIGDIRATGDVIARRYVISSSVSHITSSFSSGSTIFGDSSGDTHRFTGSLNVDGNIQSTSGDNLSIGTSWSPAGTYGVGRFHGAHNGGGTRVMFSNANSSVRYGIVMHGSDTGTADKLGIGLLLNENATYANAKPAMTIDSSKNIGMGTQSPSNKLHVYANVSNEYTALIENDQATSGNGLQIHSDGNGSGTILFDVDAAGSSRFRVRGDGSVLVGFTTSQAEKLAVNGDFRATGNISGSATSTGSFGKIDTANITENSKGIQIGTAANHTDEPLRVNNKIMIHQDSGGAGDSELTFDRRHDGAYARIKAAAGGGGAMATELHFVTKNVSSGEITALQLDDNGHIYSDLANVKISGSATSTGSFGSLVTSGDIQAGGAINIPFGEVISFEGDGGNTRVYSNSEDQIFFDIGGVAANVKFQETNNVFAQRVTTLEDFVSTATGMAFSGSATSTGSFGNLRVLNASSAWASADDFIIGNTSKAVTGMTLQSTTSGETNIAFADGVDGNAGRFAGYIRYDHNATKMIFATEGTQRVFIDGSGNVGIGETSPSEKLEVAGGIAFSGTATMTEGTDFGKATIDTDGSDRMRFHINGLNNGVYGGYEFRQSKGDHSDERLVMHIDETGNVGIGISIADGKLHVSNGLAGSVTANADADELVIENSGNAGISILTPASSNGAIYFGDPQDNNIGMIDYDHALNKLSFTAAATTTPVFSLTSNTAEFGTSITKISGSAVSSASFGRIDVAGKLFVGGSEVGSGGGGGSADNLGNHTATQDLDLNSNSIKNIIHITGSGNISGSTTTTASFGSLQLHGKTIHTTKASKVGLGTNDPLGNKLHIHVGDSGTDTVTTNSSLVIESNTNNFIQMLNPNGNNSGIIFGEHNDIDIASILHDGGDNSLRFNVAAAERIRVDGSGKVGIGNTTPGSYEGSRNDLVIGSSGNSGITIVTGTNNTGLLVFADGTSGDQAYRGQIYYSHQNDLMGLSTNGTTVRQQWTSTATEFPTANYKISGSATSTGSFGSIHTADNIGIGTTNPTFFNGGGIHISNPTAARLHLTDSDAGTGGSDGLYVAQIGTEGFLFNFENDALIFGTAVTERMRILGSGNIGVNTSNPDRLLHVHKNSAGSVTAISSTELVVEDNGDSGMSILAPDANSGNIVFGFPSDNDAVQLRGYYNGGNPRLAIELAASEKFEFIGNQLSGSSTSTGSFARLIADGSVDSRVGIGTPSPVRNLDIYDGGANGFMNLRDSTKSLDIGTATHDMVRFYEGGDVRMTISGSNVGIGVQTPDSRLEVNGTDLIGNFAGSNAGFYIRNNTPNYISFQGYGDDGFIFKDGGNERIRFESGGNVGMGITAPVGRLHLKSTGSAPSGSIAIQHSGNTVNIVEIGQSDNGNSAGAIILDKNNGIKSVHIDGHGSSFFNGGNVGFGTEIDPDTTIHMRETDDVYLTLESQNTGVTKEVALKYQNYSTGTDFWWVGLNQSDDYSLAYGSAFSAANTKFLVTETGNVGIGTITPGHRLHVVGDIRATGDIIANRLVVSSSVSHITASFSSGSTIFGDDTGDTHRFTGSLSVSGSGDKVFEVVSSPGAVPRFRIDNDATNTIGINTTPSTGLVAIRSTGNDAHQLSFLNGSGTHTGGFYDAGGRLILQLKNSSGTTKVNIESGGDSYFNGGNVGIGDATPSYPLDVAGIIASTDAVGVFRLVGTSSGRTYDLKSNAGRFEIRDVDNGQDRLIIGTNGNVGIGDGLLTPGAKLTVDGDISGSSTSTGSFGEVKSTTATIPNLQGNVALSPTNVTPASIGSDARWITLDGTNYSGGPAYTVDGTIKAGHYWESNYLRHQGIANNTGHKFTVRDGSGNYLHHFFESDGNVEFVGNVSSSATSTGSFGALSVPGQATIGSVVEASSIMYKENVKQIESPLEKITKLRGVEFDYKKTNEHSIGMIAEEVNEIFPELVAKNEDGDVTAMSYTRMTAVLLEAVKELSAEVKELRELNNYSKSGDKK